MFNLKSHSAPTVNLLEAELGSFDIKSHPQGYHVIIGDESLDVSSLTECYQKIKEGISELRESIWELWQKVEYLTEVIVNNEGGNKGSLDNILFLNNAKKLYLLSRRFSGLESASEALRNLFDVDIDSVHNSFIVQFNQTALSVKLIHKLIMIELYRLKLIEKYRSTNKYAQVSGPWANLDLPMKERVWEWDDGEDEYFQEREKSRKEQIRYNPENQDKTGFFFVWQDRNRDPYTWENRHEESPYKSRLLLQIP